MGADLFAGIETEGWFKNGVSCVLGVGGEVLRKLAEGLRDHGRLMLGHSTLHRCHVCGGKKGDGVGFSKRGKLTNLAAITMGTVFLSAAVSKQEEYGIEVIAPHRGIREKPPRMVASLHRYRIGWTVERLFTWLQIYRRLATRWEYHIETFFGGVRLGCMKKVC